VKRSSVKVLKTLGKFRSWKGRKMATAAALSLTALVAACSAQNDRFAGDTYRIPWSDSNGQMAMRPVRLRTFSNPEKFEGSAAKILIEPSESGGKLVSEKPQGKYIRASDGTLIAADYMTLQAVTAYAHQEKLQAFDQKAGVASLLNWPLTVGVQVKVLDRGSLVSNNAIYDGKLDALLIVPYDYSRLPIAFNGGILAHEHFHFLFQQMILNRVGNKETQGCQHGIAGSDTTQRDDTEEGENGLDLDDQEAIDQAAAEIPPQVYNSFVLRAMNEGLADFWGWVYSSDHSFVGRSLPSEDRVRRLDLEPGRLADTKTLKESLVDLRRADKIIREDYRVGRAYLIGTQYARFLREMVDGLVDEGMDLQEAKLAVAQALTKALPTLAAATVRAYTTEFLSPNTLLKPPRMSQRACDDLDQFHALEAGFEKPRPCLEPQSAKPAATPAPPPTETPEPTPEPTATPASAPAASPAPTATPAPGARVKETL
jgi:hypothetical protein